ncbi:MAG: hypothetical protein HY717_15445, partial [Planctomycetes bacterium]|nr:hypothetical protein [Planctomycetota bacterium]
MLRIKVFSAVSILNLVASLGLFAQGENLVPNPNFQGTGGQALPIGTGTVTANPGVPDNWRAFAVNGGIEVDVELAAADEIFAGSPETNVVCFRIISYGADQGFDDDNGRFPISVGVDYHGEFYVKSGNADGSEQRFNFGFPLFGPGGYLGREPGGLNDRTATGDWQLVTGSMFRDGEAVQAHISWRCIGDGGEDRICIALPFVSAEVGQVLPPTGLFCRRVRASVELTWTNQAAYEKIRIERDGSVLAELAGDATSYPDLNIPEGTLHYQVVAVAPNLQDGPSCEVTYLKVNPGARASIDLGDPDTENGMKNTFRQDGTDGENEFLICGPNADLREARSNLAGTDNDAPDGFFYFTVTDPAMKSQEAVRIEATVYDDPALTGASLTLEYTNNLSRGGGDIPNTFFAAPAVRTLAGTGEWATVSWQLEDAGFRSFQQGVADFRIGAGGARVCLDSAVVNYFPAPGPLACRRTPAGVALSWENPIAYATIEVQRDGGPLAQIPGDSSSYPDVNVPDGDHTYQVLGVISQFEGYLSRPCNISVINVPSGTKVSVDLGEINQENGLANSQTVDPGDGENDFGVCGPLAEPSEGRSNRGATDNDFPDSLFYFNVTDPAVKAQAEFKLEMTVYDDPALAGLNLYLQYTNNRSTGPLDFSNTFFPLENPPVRMLNGTGAWTVLAWDITEAGFRTFQQGSSDFRVGVAGGNERVCVDRVDLTVVGGAPPPPRFRRGDLDDSGAVDISDPINELHSLFLGDFEITCLDAADFDDSGQVDISDAINSLLWQFASGSIAPDPGPFNCGPDLTPDRDDQGNPIDLGCVL